MNQRGGKMRQGSKNRKQTKQKNRFSQTEANPPVVDSIDWRKRILEGSLADRLNTVEEAGRRKDIKAVPALMKLLADLNGEEFEVKTIDTWIKEGNDAVQELLRVRCEVKQKIVDVFVKIGEDAFHELLRALCYADRDADKEVKEALGLMKNPRIIPGVIDALRDKSMEVRRKASWMFLSVKPNEEQYQMVLGMLKSELNEERCGAAMALGSIRDQRSIPALIEALGDEDPTVKEEVVCSLEKLSSGKYICTSTYNKMNDIINWRMDVSDLPVDFNPDTRAVIPLTEALNDEDDGVRFYVISALRKIGDPRADTALINVLRTDDNANIRSLAATVLGEICVGQEVVQALWHALKDRDYMVSKAAGNALVSISENPNELGYMMISKFLRGDLFEKVGAVSALVELLKHADEPVVLELIKGTLSASQWFEWEDAFLNIAIDYALKG
jgi:HEAT repeat protein